MRTLREESEAANEELRAANEELQSINEEYRSTAEELETSKEELQSINEELQTVNSELKLKLETVSRANSDLQNLMAAMDFGTLFLDPNLRINRFTPRLADLFSITPTDVGRPITDFSHRLDYDDLAADARRVLSDLVPIEREIGSRTGNWYLARFRPYRTIEDKIEGVVATFVDVTERRRMEDALRSSEDRLQQESRLVEQSRSPIFVWDFDGGIVQWNRGSEELYGYSAKEAVGRQPQELLGTTIDGGSAQPMIKALTGKGVWSGELRQAAKDGTLLIVDTQLELLNVQGGRLVLESSRDITAAKTLENRQRLLLNELTHRVRNVLTVVQSVVHQSWRRGDREHFLDRVDGRIAALAEAHKLLVESEWEGADLKRLALSQLTACPGEETGRLTLKGPPVTLPAEVATPFGMVLHELATNAVKHGAFSTAKGKVDLDWELSKGNSPPVLKVVWRERGGPPVKEPSGFGFGARLIRQGLPGAKVKHEFRGEGVRYETTIPLPSDGGG